jgi:hypothetical protein
MAAGTTNLLHTLSEIPCEDPDCELHHPEVGREEEVVSLTDLAFFLAGAQTLANLLRNRNMDDETITSCLSELKDLHIHPGV